MRSFYSGAFINGSSVYREQKVYKRLLHDHCRSSLLPVSWPKTVHSSGNASVVKPLSATKVRSTAFPDGRRVTYQVSQPTPIPASAKASTLARPSVGRRKAVSAIERPAIKSIRMDFAGFKSNAG